MTQLHTNTTQTAETPSAAPVPAPAASPATPLTQRGQYRARVPWYVAVLCRVGIHGGPWTYLAEGQCTQMRECSRCGATKVRTKHQRQWVYVSDGKCEQVRTCTRCKALSGDRIEHVWSESYTVQRSWWQSDKRAHRCQRCGGIETWTVNDD